MRMSVKFSLLAASLSIATFNTALVAQRSDKSVFEVTSSNDYASNHTALNAPKANSIFANTTTVNTETKKTDVTPELNAPVKEEMNTLYITPVAPKNSSKSPNSKSIKVSWNSDMNKTLDVRLTNADGEVLFHKKTTDCKHINELLNLKNLEQGAYSLIVQKDAIKTIQPFELNSQGVVMNEKMRTIKFLPQLIQKGTYLDINAMLSQFGNVKVNIYDGDGKLVFEENITKVITLNKRYNLKQLGRGEFTAEVLADNETTYLALNF